MPEKFTPTEPLSEINVTPFVDVMLVLLVIFMVTAPMFSQGLPVNLPAAAAPALMSERPVVISISRERQIFLGDRQIGLENLKGALGQEARGDKGPEVLLKADQEVPYGLVVQVMSALKAAGVEKLGMVTAPASQEVRK